MLWQFIAAGIRCSYYSGNIAGWMYKVFKLVGLFCEYFSAHKWQHKIFLSYFVNVLTQ